MRPVVTLGEPAAIISTFTIRRASAAHRHRPSQAAVAMRCARLGVPAVAGGAARERVGCRPTIRAGHPRAGVYGRSAQPRRDGCNDQ